MKRQKLKKKQRFQLIQLAEYFVSGGAYFWTGYLVFFVADKGFHWTLWWAKLSANIIGWIINYLLQRYWVFKNPKLNQHRTQVTGRYIFITLVDFVLDYFIVRELKAVGITPYIGQFVSSGFFTFWNYVWYRFWVFPEHMKKHKTKVTLPRVVAHRAHGHSAYHSSRS
jgi:putative flippase GtrA